MMTTWLWVWACATLPQQRLQQPLAPLDLGYDLTLEAQFSTRGEDGLQVDLGPETLALQGRVTLSQGPRYRDGSLGTVLRFDTLVDGATGEPHGLAGRAIELRAFESGEVLEVRGLEHLAGAGRHGDVLDVLIPLFSPKVPELGRQEEAVSTTSYPVTVVEGRGHRVDLVARWTLGPEVARGIQAVHYEGQLKCKGSDLGIRVSCAGAVEGDLVGSRQDGLARSALRLSRTVALQGPGGTLVQEQVFDAEAVLVGASSP